MIEDDWIHRESLTRRFLSYDIRPETYDPSTLAEDGLVHITFAFGQVRLQIDLSDAAVCILRIMS